MEHGTLKQLAKLRTYKDDFAQARGGSTSSSEGTSKPTTAAAPVVTAKPAQSAPPHAAPVRPRLPEPKPPVKNAHVPPPMKAAAKPVPSVAPAVASVLTPAASSALSPNAARAIKEDLEKVRTVKRSSILSSGDDVFDVAQAHTASGEATIVTDTRQTRFRLFPAIAAAFKDWLFEKKESFEERQKPKFTVAPGSTRSAVVQKAAQGGALAPKSDYERVASRLRHVPRTSEPAAAVIKKAADMPAPSWTHTDEAPELEPTVPKPPQATAETQAPLPIQPSPVNETSIPQAPAAAAERPAPEPPRMPAPPPAPEPVHEPELEPKAAPTEPGRNIPVPPEIPRERIASQAGPAPEQDSRKDASASAAGQYRFRPVAPRSPYPFIIAAIAAAALGIFAAFWFFGDAEAPAAPRAEDASAIGAPSTASVPFVSDPTEFLQNLAAATVSAPQSSITELVPTITDGGARRANTAEVLGVLELRAPGTFVRGISSISFGSYRAAEPFIVLELSSFDTALGGMLAWESAMSADLAPLFGAPITDTYDPLSGRNEADGAYFIDTVYENRDVRVLYDGEGDERIAYTFLDRTTVLITTTRTALGAIAPLIR